jgi:peptide/nickel transport system permease protein
MAQLWIAMKWLLLPPSSVYDLGHEGEFGNYLLHMILPWSVMTLCMLVSYLKVLRTGLIEVLPHMDFPNIIANAGIVGYVFNVGGIGDLIIEEMQAHEYPVVVGAFMVVAAIAVALNWLVDIVYVFVDPRIRYSQRAL